MRLAVIGAGQIVAEFLPHATEVPGLELAAIQGRRREHLETLQEQFGIERVYTDFGGASRTHPSTRSGSRCPTLCTSRSHARRSRRANTSSAKPFVLESELEAARARHGA